jgi:hypothetical protein
MKYGSYSPELGVIIVSASHLSWRKQAPASPQKPQEDKGYGWPVH